MQDPFKNLRDIQRGLSLRPVSMPNYAAESAQRMDEMNQLLRRAAHAKSAEGFAARLVEEVRQYQARLDPTKDVGVSLASFGRAVTIHVTDIGYIEPSFIVFEGLAEEGTPVRLVQHVNQISFLLTSVPLEPGEARSRIGFMTGAESPENEAE